MRDHLVFYLNGARHTVRGDEATLTLSEYLRHGPSLGSDGFNAERLCGTKIACAEGDCGACTVLVGKPATDGFEYETIDACIAFLFQMDRRHVVTVEGVGDPAGLSAVQQAMVDCHGSQCGFCTPGFVMALHGQAEDQDAAGFEEDALRLGLSGNLCRCTGYEQILEAGRSLANARVQRVSERYEAAPMLEDFAKLGDEAVLVGGASHGRNGHAANGQLANKAAVESPHAGVFLPTTLEQLTEHRAKHPAARLVSGATDLGVQRNHGKIELTDAILTTRVAELDQLEVIDGSLVIGASVSWSRIEDFVRETVPRYYDILTRFGSPQVRHAGTLAGNLANASPIADSIPFHYVAGSTLELASVRGVRSVPIEDFYLGYKQLDLKPDEVIASIATPLPTKNVDLRLYKISKRRDMDISTVTLAFWIERDGDVVETVRIAAGGVGPTVVRLPKAEAAVKGEPFTLAAMQSAGEVARGEIAPLSDVRGSADYRLQLVENLFAKCWHEIAGEAAIASSQP